jgi:dipeptidyl-peptidase 4
MWHDVNTGLVSTLVSFDQLLPEGQKNAITIDDYSISSDRSKILIFTESIKVWRLKTKGSYWILDLNNKHQLFQLGKALPNPKILMFATLSPDSSKVAYVCEHNLYVEDLITGITTPLTSDGSSHVINGTFDWVYEEEFHLRNGFRSDVLPTLCFSLSVIGGRQMAHP